MSDEPLSRPEIEALQRQLSLLSEPAVRDAYVQAHARCCLGRGELPNPAEVQRFLRSCNETYPVATGNELRFANEMLANVTRLARGRHLAADTFRFAGLAGKLRAN